MTFAVELNSPSQPIILYLAREGRSGRGQERRAEQRRAGEIETNGNRKTEIYPEESEKQKPEGERERCPEVEREVEGEKGREQFRERVRDQQKDRDR